MTKRNTIITFYAIIAVICVGILTLVSKVIVPNLQAKGQETEAFVKIQAKKEQSWFPIEKDLKATNQAGEKVKLSDLRGKVWVVAEFFAVCPHCAVRNGAELRKIYDEFKDDPDFQMVCISVDPSQDDVEKLADYSDALGADVDDWWFLNAGEEKATHDYLENTLKFFGIRERSDPAEIEASGRFSHDLGLILVDKDFKVIGKWPLADARSDVGRELDPELYERLKKEMFGRIRTELDKDKTTQN